MRITWSRWNFKSGNWLELICTTENGEDGGVVYQQQQNNDKTSIMSVETVS